MVIYTWSNISLYHPRNMASLRFKEETTWLGSTQSRGLHISWLLAILNIGAIIGPLVSSICISDCLDLIYGDTCGRPYKVRVAASEKVETGL